jgi:AcrR family transcriptional regulator
VYTDEYTLSSDRWPYDSVMVEPRQLLRRDERRAQILETAAAAFSRQGYAATSVEEVAQEAGITKLIVYRHFESKSELYSAILDQVGVRLAEEWTALPEPDQARGAALQTLLTVARELPDGFRLLFVHAAREQEFASFATEVRALQIGLADHILGGLIEEGPFRQWVLKMTIDYLIAAVLEWIEVGDPDDDAWWVGKADIGLRAAVTAWVLPATDWLPTRG